MRQRLARALRVFADRLDPRPPVPEFRYVRARNWEPVTNWEPTTTFGTVRMTINRPLP